MSGLLELPLGEVPPAVGVGKEKLGGAPVPSKELKDGRRRAGSGPFTFPVLPESRRSRTLRALSLQPHGVLPLGLCSYRFTNTSWFTSVSGGAAPGSCQGIRRQGRQPAPAPASENDGASEADEGLSGIWVLTTLSLPRERSDGRSLLSAN